MLFNKNKKKMKSPTKMKIFFQYLGHHCVLDSENNYIELLKKEYNIHRNVDCFLASPNNPRSQNVLKTIAAVKREIRHHLKYHRYMIHPLSDFRFYWESFLIFGYIAAVIVVPVQFFTYLYDYPICKSRTMNIIRTSINFIWITEMFFSFFTGYIEQTSDYCYVIMNRKRVCLNYLKSYFIFDICASFPYMILSCEKVDRIQFILGMGTLFKLSRAGRLFVYAKRLLHHLSVHYYAVKLFALIGKILIIIHWSSSLEILPGLIQDTLLQMKAEQWYEVTNLKNCTFLEQYAYCFYRAMSTLSCTGFNMFHSEKSASDMMYFIFLVIFGRTLHCIMFAQILSLIIGLRYSTGKYEEMVNQLTKYMKHKNLPQSTKKKINSYYAYRYQHYYFKEQKILNTIPFQLKEDIIMHSSRRFLENVSFFANLPMKILTKLVECLHSETFLTNEIIIRAGAFGDCMYFITAGTVAVYTATGKEVCHLADGDHFGEISLVSEHKMRTATIVAVETSEIYRLDLVDFNHIVTPYPDLMHNVQRIATSRLENLLLFEEQSNRNNFKSMFMRNI